MNPLCNDLGGPNVNPLFTEGLEFGDVTTWAGNSGNDLFYAQFIYNLDSPGIPTLNEWGLIAMAAILGIVGFMVIRRRKVTA